MDVSVSQNCIVCEVALAGALGWVSKLGGVRRSDGNPSLCNRCNDHVAEGKIREVGIFFVDLSNYTSMTETLGPEKTHAVLDSFLRKSSEIITAHDGYVSQYVGDEIMAFFNAPIDRADYANQAVKAAVALQSAVSEIGKSFQLPLDVTIGIGSGHARIGHVGAEGVAHVSAIGDVVNRAARLVAKSEPGGMLIDESIYSALDDELRRGELEEVALKGFAEPVKVARYVDVGLLASTGDASTRRPVSIVTSLAAILSAPCAGYVALNSLALAFGGGALGMGALAIFLDQSIIRIPLLTIATLGSLTILGLSARQNRQNTSSESAVTITPTQYEVRRNRIGLAVSIVTLLIVAAELYAHTITH